MLTKQDILEAIQTTTAQCGGKPLGAARFEQETSIRPYDWERFWARFGDAQKEAGFEPNQLQGPLDNEFLFKKIIGLARKLRKFPTYREITVEKGSDPEFPGQKSFYRLGTKEQFTTIVMEYCKTNSTYEDVIRFCEVLLEQSNKEERAEEGNISIGEEGNINIGEVYLFKSGRYCKIGRTSDTVRRGHEIRIQLPERMDFIHSIKTDDPSGVEAYWHRRFEPKRMNGEWFDLSAADIKAFKRWRRIF